MLVDDLVAQARVQLDEASPTDLSDAKILQALNRGQQKLVRLATRRYPSMFKREVTVASTAGSREIRLPDLAFGLSVNQVDTIQNGQAYRIDPALESQLWAYDDTTQISTTEYPQYYAQRGNTLQLYPLPRGLVDIRVRYQVRPPDLVLSQGRITAIDLSAPASPRVELDAVGSELTASIAALKGFVNWIDGMTGLVRATLQVASIDTTTKRVTFKTTALARTTVFGLTVSDATPATGALDDYLTIANGTCVPTLVQDYADYIIQFAVLELQRRAGVDTNAEYAALKELEADITAMWAGREGGNLRVRRTNQYWGQHKLPTLARYR